MLDYYQLLQELFIRENKTDPISFDSFVPKSRLKIVFTSGLAVKNNGGTKLYNLWVKLLRKNGYDAYIATVNGKYDKWMVDHQPVISYKMISNFIDSGDKVILVTSWLDFPFEKIDRRIKQFYYFDAELHWTLKFKKKLDTFLKQGKIAGIATHSRYIQSWYMATYDFKPLLINEWSDRNIFFPNGVKRIDGRVGVMPETDEDKGILRYLLERNKNEKLIKEFVVLKGSEKEVSRKMKTLDIFIGLNKGKDDIWGEGCPRTQQEAMHSGDVLIAFDCIGNREYLINGYTGLLVSKYDGEEMWKGLKSMLTDKTSKESIRSNGLKYVQGVFSDRDKFALISRFLGLGGISKTELTSIFDRPFWLQEDEVQFLSRYAAIAKETIVEIGCAYGGSSTIFLLNKNKDTRLYSIDPFVEDSMGGFKANKNACRRAVSRALAKKKRKGTLLDWTLMHDYSYNVAKKWDKKIDLLFIDGSHLYSDVKKDFWDWENFVEKEGKILIHDSRKTLKDPRDKVFLMGWNGPTRLVSEIVKGGKYKLIDSCYSISVLKKV